MPNLQRRADLAHTITFVLMAIYLGALSLYYLNLSWIGLIDHFPWLRWGISVIAIVAFIPSLLKRNGRAAIWFCFILLIYFMKAVEACFTENMLWIGLFEAISVSLLFVAAMMFARWQFQLNNQKQN